MTESRSVSDVGEWALIDAITRHLANPPDDEVWSGDDAAVLTSSPERLVFTSDVLVEAVDFDLSYCPADSVGHKAVAVNASDVAAMGAVPRWLVATLTLDPDTPVEVVEGIAEGMASAGKRFGVGVVGGDISSGRDLALSIAMIGTLPGEAALRSGAGVGDLICVTGPLGGAAAGLLLLQSGTRDRTDAAERLMERQLRPRPRVSEGPLLAGAGITSMIDISDGLLADLTHVLDASEVGCQLDRASVPIDPDIGEVSLPDGTDPLTLTLTGGEDFELLFTVPPAHRDEVESALEQTDAAVNVIGEVTRSGRKLGDLSLDGWKDKGWEHLRHP